MHRRQLETTPNTTDLSQAPQLETLERETAPRQPYDLLTQPTALGVGSASNPVAQAAALKHATSGQLSRAGNSLLQLQRQYGNRYVQQVVTQARQSQPTNRATAPVIQAKLVVGPVSDQHEREADRVAKHVASQSFSPGQTARTQINKEGQAGRLMRKPDIQTGHNNTGAAAVDAGVQQTIQQARGSGRPLPGNIRTAMEQALGADFSRVRTHADTRSDRLNQSLQAQAFTTGQDIFFRQGAYRPGSQSGRELLAHELTHVVQQGGQRGGEAKSVSTLQRKPVPISEGSRVCIDAKRLDLGQLLYEDTRVFEDGRKFYLFKSSALERRVIYDVSNDSYKPAPPQQQTQQSQAKATPPPTHQPRLGRYEKPPQSTQRQSPQTPGFSYRPPPRAKPRTLDQASRTTPPQWRQPAPPTQRVIPQVQTPSPRPQQTKSAAPLRGTQPIPPTQNQPALGTPLHTGQRDKETGKTAGGLAKRLADLADTVNTALGAKGLERKGESSTLADPTKADIPEMGMAEYGAASSGVGAVGGVFTLVKSVENLVHKGGWDRAKAGMNVTKATVNLGANIADIIDKAGQLTKGDVTKGFGTTVGAAGKAASTVAAKSLGTIGEIFSAIVKAVERVKEFVDLAKDTKKSGMTKGEAWDAIMGSIKDAAEMAQSAATSAKNIMTVAETTGTNMAVKQAIPGLGIVASALDAIFRAWEFVRAARGQAQMRTEKRKIKMAKPESFIEDGGKRKVDIEKELAGQPSYAKKTQLTAELGIVDEYLAAKELQSINEKRMRRQGIKIAFDLAKIGGDAASLFPPGAVAGLSIKTVTSATELSLSVQRRLQQWGRDVAAKKAEKRAQAGGDPTKKSKTERIFNPKKSSEEKAKKRDQVINQLFRMMVNATNSGDPNQLERVKMYFRAAGLSWRAVQRYKDANDLAAALDEALKKRE